MRRIGFVAGGRFGGSKRAVSFFDHDYAKPRPSFGNTVQAAGGAEGCNIYMETTWPLAPVSACL